MNVPVEPEDFDSLPGLDSGPGYDRSVGYHRTKARTTEVRTSTHHGLVGTAVLFFLLFVVAVLMGRLGIPPIGRTVVHFQAEVTQAPPANHHQSTTPHAP